MSSACCLLLVACSLLLAAFLNFFFILTHYKLLATCNEQNLAPRIDRSHGADFFSLNSLTSCCPVQVVMRCDVAWHIVNGTCTCTIAVNFPQLQHLIPDPLESASIFHRTSPIASGSGISSACACVWMPSLLYTTTRSCPIKLEHMCSTIKYFSD